MAGVQFSISNWQRSMFGNCGGFGGWVTDKLRAAGSVRMQSGRSNPNVPFYQISVLLLPEVKKEGRSCADVGGRTTGRAPGDLTGLVRTSDESKLPLALPPALPLALLFRLLLLPFLAASTLVALMRTRGPPYVRRGPAMFGLAGAQLIRTGCCRCWTPEPLTAISTDGLEI